MAEEEGSLTEEAKKETQEYIHHIGERVHKMQILAQKCYDAVKNSMKRWRTLQKSSRI